MGYRVLLMQFEWDTLREALTNYRAVCERAIESGKSQPYEAHKAYIERIDGKLRDGLARAARSFDRWEEAVFRRAARKGQKKRTPARAGSARKKRGRKR